MVAACDVGFDTVSFVQAVGDQFWGDVGRVDINACNGKGRVRNNVQRCEFVFIGRAAIRRVHIVDQAFVQRPSVH